MSKRICLHDCGSRVGGHESALFVKLLILNEYVSSCYTQ